MPNSQIVYNQIGIDDKMLLLKEVIPLTFLQSPTIETVLAISTVVPIDFQSLNRELIQKEFTKFFRVPGKDYLPPYESYWVLKKFPDEPFCAPRLYSRTTEEITDIYNALQIFPLSDFSEPPDHIGFELAVYFAIHPYAEHSEQSSCDVNKVIETFIVEHFNKWVPEYLWQLSLKQGVLYPYLAKYLLDSIR